MMLALCGSSPKVRQPNWRPSSVEHYPNGNPLRVIFYEKDGDSKELPVKELTFYPNGGVKEERDLELLPSGEMVFHGAAIGYHPSGKIAELADFERGQLEGEVKSFHSNGQLHSTVFYEKGKKEGNFVSYYPSGEKEEEAVYQGDLLVNEQVCYYRDGLRESLTYYEEGLPHGEALEWFPEEKGVKVKRLYLHGLLHGEGNHPAVTIYSEDQRIIEIQDFRGGKPEGLHLKYHDNGKVAYRLKYKEGEKLGQKQFFDRQGVCNGGGKYQGGVPIGEHVERYDNGQLKRVARYSMQGTLLEPVVEYVEEGDLLRSYFLNAGEYHGEFREWYAGEKLKCHYSYNRGVLEGEQQEFYPSGAAKCKAFYRNEAKDGLFEEWYEDGKPKL